MVHLFLLPQIKMELLILVAVEEVVVITLLEVVDQVS